MKNLKTYLLHNSRHIIILTALFVILFWRIGTYPNYFDACVECAIHPQVNKVLDNEVVPKEVTWLWTDMYQHAAGRSPVYAAPIELGLGLFGLTLFGVRIFTAVLAFLVLILVYRIMIKIYPPLFATVFVILLATSPWYLIMTRSGGIVGFSLTLVLLSFCLIAQMFVSSMQHNKETNINTGNKIEKKGMNNNVKPGAGSYIIAILAGVSVAILPYGHASVRIIPILLVIWVMLLYKKLTKTHIALFLMSIFIVVSVQFEDIKVATKSYFNARGEGLFEVAKNVKATDPDFLINKLLINIKVLLRFVFGANSMKEFWNPNMANSYWMPDIVLYPRFLVPFFIIGFVLCLINFFKKRTLLSGTPILLFFVSMAPGLVAGLGDPNAARNYIMIVPIYYFVAHALYSLFMFFYNKLKSRSDSKKRTIARYCLIGLSIFVLVFTAFYQVNNFYTQEKGALDEKYTPAHSIYSYLKDYFKYYPDGRVLIHELPAFGQYSYVTIRWLGGKDFEDKLKSGQVRLLKFENRVEIENLVQQGYFDIIMSSSGDDELHLLLPDLKNMQPLERERYKLYKMKR